jgi:hypothetical protein
MMKGRGQRLIIAGYVDRLTFCLRNRNGKERSSDSTTCDPLIGINDCEERSLEASRVLAIAALSPYRASRRGNLDAPLCNGLSTRSMPDANEWPALVGAPSIVSSDLQRAPCKPRCEVSWSEGMRHANRAPYTLKSV